jgi:hypothetical protein
VKKDLESKIEQEFRLAVKRMGGAAYKFVSPGNSGVPDRLVVLPGGIIGFVELKRPGERLRKQQVLRIHKLQELGCFAAVVNDLDQIRPTLRRLQSFRAGLQSFQAERGEL